jgi:FixJ family two-component response regulator
MVHSRDFVIYVVVHDDAVRDSICVLLDSMRFPTCGFKSANAFLRSERRPTGDSCLIADEEMADMSGYELLDRLRSEGLRTSAIIMTQRMNARKQPASGRAGVIVLEKPYAPDKLIGCVSKALFPDQS